MRKYLVIAAMLVTSPLLAQDLVIQYDFIKDEYKYFKNGNEVSQPVVKRNYEVKVLVKNLNPFVFVARCQWKQQVAADNSTTSGLASMFSGLAAGPVGLSSLLSGLDMKQFEELGLRGSNSLLSSNLNAKMALTGAIESYNKLSGAEQTLNRVESSTARLRKLKLNPYLPYDTLKNIANILASNSLSVPKPSKNQAYSASHFLQLSANLSNTLTTEFENLVNYSSAFLQEYQTYSTKTGGDFAEAGMDKTINSMLLTAKNLKAKYDAEKINEQVEQLEQQYEIIQYTPFTYTCNYLTTGDQLSLTLDFFESSAGNHSDNNLLPGSDPTDTMRKVRTKTVNIMIHGDMKISTSIGLGFPTYFNNNKTWTNRDSSIYGAPGNNYSPCISTYVNFYPYTGRNLHLGGTFGIGIPVQNEGTSALNFFLGGSAVLGSSSKVVIHGGLAIGQLNVLTSGLKEGDHLRDDVTLPTTKKTFKPGAFFGISFALNK